MCFSLQMVIKASVKGLRDRKLAEKIIEDERKIHLGTLAETRITISDVEEHMKMVTEMKDQQIIASKAAAFDADKRRSGRNANLVGVNWESGDSNSNQGHFQNFPNWNQSRIIPNAHENTDNRDIQHYLPPKQSSSHPIIKGDRWDHNPMCSQCGLSGHWRPDCHVPRSKHLQPWEQGYLAYVTDGNNWTKPDGERRRPTSITREIERTYQLRHFNSARRRPSINNLGRDTYSNGNSNRGSFNGENAHGFRNQSCNGQNSSNWRESDQQKLPQNINLCRTQQCDRRPQRNIPMEPSDYATHLNAFSNQSSQSRIKDSYNSFSFEVMAESKSESESGTSEADDNNLFQVNKADQHQNILLTTMKTRNAAKRVLNNREMIE